MYSAVTGWMASFIEIFKTSAEETAAKRKRKTAAIQKTAVCPRRLKPPLILWQSRRG